ncbi:DNA-binding response regulator [Saccharophagus sp. K07]|uniref:response regulator transcription factor n=1 Tax=Saccharophagus sp. K07 TaxID=2283636 RepID=UPI00165217EE|nr:response regulator transcription factor [Saccharophagus sp. K07]MBC6904103.1 DNA-binding response regulator [Saccharophagus sp. K07]
MANPTQIRLFLVEDQTLVRDALAQLLALQPDFVVVGTAANGLEAQKAIPECRPDLVLSDIEMPGCDGLTLCRWLHEHHPSIKTVILTTFNRSGYVQRALQAEARGFILKEVPVDTLANQLRNIHSGQRVYDTELLIAGLHDHDPLTERERQALRLAEQGLSTADIARKLYLSEGTVRNYLSESMAKLCAGSRNQAAKIAREKGWL